MVLAADCMAFALGDFHARFLKGKILAIACPKLDEGQEEYIEKIRRMADEAEINTLTVIIMQVPCCRGLIQIAQAGLNKATRKVPLKVVTSRHQRRDTFGRMDVAKHLFNNQVNFIVFFPQNTIFLL